jgi:hypothetical protein
MFNKLFSAIANWIGTVQWQQRHGLTDVEKQQVMEMLKKDYYVIMTRNSNHLATYAISIANFFICGKFGYYGHVLLNLEDQVQGVQDFRLAEAIGVGTKFSTFDQVFGDIDGVCLMKPRSMTIDEWTGLLDKAKSEMGKPYDTLFDIKNDQALSCVELTRDVLMAEPNYKTDFANFEALVASSKNLTPQMFRDCIDFEPVLEIKHKW